MALLARSTAYPNDRFLGDLGGLARENPGSNQFMHQTAYAPAAGDGVVLRRNEMASLDMDGSYQLTIKKIDDEVTRVSPGNYALDYTKDAIFEKNVRLP